jgi:hypothetical protein
MHAPDTIAPIDDHGMIARDNSLPWPRYSKVSRRELRTRD